MPSFLIPRDLAEIDAAWLSAALGADIVRVEPAGPTGGIPVTSRVVRLRLESRPPGSAPERVVVKITNPAWTHGSELHAREVRFYRDFAPGRDLPVPRCHVAEYDETSGAFVLVLEDVGDLRPGHRLDGLTGDEADAVIDGVAELHRAWWGHDALTHLKVRGHAPERIAATIATFGQRWSALEASGKYVVDRALRDVLPAVTKSYAEGMDAISRRPQTLIHSDLHVENFFLEQTPRGLRLIAIDWQNASHGHCAFDLSHVLSSLRPELVAGCHDRLLRRYHARVAPDGYRLDELRRDLTAAVRHQFVGSANWFATFEAESLRDAATIQGHWTRLCACLVALHRT